MRMCTSACSACEATTLDQGEDGCGEKCRSVDVAGFWELMHEALDAADAASPLNKHGAEPLLTAAVL